MKKFKNLLVGVVVACTPFLFHDSIVANDIYIQNNPMILNKEKEKINFSNTPELWGKKATEIEDKLLNDKPIEIKNMREYLLERDVKADFYGNVFVIVLDNGLKCVFKHYDDKQEETKTKAEVIAWKLCKETGIGNVPPVIWREIKLNNGKTVEGYLSLFVNSEIDISKYEDDELFELLEKMNKTEINNYKIFNFIFGNFDVGAHNLLICGGKPIMIDNETINNPWCVRYGEVPFVNFYNFDKISDKPIKSSSFPFELAKFANFEEREKIKNDFDYSPTKKEHNFILHKNGYWVQFTRRGLVRRIKQLIYTDNIPNSTREALKNLSYEKLLKIFEADKNNKHVNQLISGILERRDMLLKSFFKKQM